MKNTNLATWTALGIGGYLLYRQLVPPTPSVGQIRALTQQWLDTLCAGSRDAVVGRYGPDGILVGTLATKVKRGRSEIAPYFDMFLAKKGICGEVLSDEIQTGPGWGISSGIYQFSWVEDGAPQSVTARFSYVFAPTAEGWKIVHHHSSAMPDPVR